MSISRTLSRSALRGRIHGPEIQEYFVEGGDKGRDDLFAGSPPLEAKRMLLSRAATKRGDGRWRKHMR